MLVPMDLPSRIFLSPHPDDIAYSCYASLVNPPAPRLDAIQIITVFSVSVRANGELGQRRCQEEITRVRQKEDEKFAHSERCRLVRLGFPDSSVRGETNRGLELSIDDSTKHPMFKSVKTALAKSIGAAIGYASIYIPLGIGNHVDHRMVRDAARMLAMESNVPGALAGLRYYEDLPYAAFVEEHEIRRLAKRVVSPTPTSYVVRLENFWVRKSRAVRTYVSQLSPVVLKAFADHSSAVSNSEFPGEERLWISDPLAVAPAVDVLAWVTREAAHKAGDYTAIFANAFPSASFQSSVGRNILMGPLYSPQVRPRNGVLEDVQCLAGVLGCYILYPPQISNGWGLKKRMHALLRDIESRYGVGIYYLRDREQDHLVDRVLFDFTAEFDRHDVHEPALQGFLRDLKRRMNVSVDIDIGHYAADHRRRASSVTAFRHSGNAATSISNSSWGFRSAKAENDNDTRDTVLGLLLALPVSDCLRGLTEPDETAVLMSTDNLSLPAGYAVKMQGEIYAASKGPTIKTLYYCCDVAPIRKLATGVAAPDVPTLDAVGGFDWEGPVRALVNFSLEHAPLDEQHMPILRRYFLDYEPLREFASHTDLRMVQQAWRLDGIAAASANIRDELLFFNRTFALRGEIPVVASGIGLVPCAADLKERSRRKLISYARLVWGFDKLESENTVVATQTTHCAQPDSFLRSINALRAFAAQLPTAHAHGSKNVLFVIVTGWNEQQRHAHKYCAVSELLQLTGGALSFTSTNLYVRLVTQPQWPIEPEHHARATGLSREDFVRAADLSFCLDTYNAFATTVLEPISSGAIAVVSTGCGAHRALNEIDVLGEHMVLVDYAQTWTSDIAAARENDLQGIIDDVFDVTLEERRLLACATHERLATQLRLTVPWTAAARAARVSSGRRIAMLLSWEDRFSMPLVAILRQLSGTSDRADGSAR